VESDGAGDERVLLRKRGTGLGLPALGFLMSGVAVGIPSGWTQWLPGMLAAPLIMVAAGLGTAALFRQTTIVVTARTDDDGTRMVESHVEFLGKKHHHHVYRQVSAMKVEKEFYFDSFVASTTYHVAVVLADGTRRRISPYWLCYVVGGLGAEEVEEICHRWRRC